MDLINFLLYSLAGLSIFLAFFIYSKGRQKQSHQSFSLLTLAGGIWAFSIAMFRRSDTLSQAFFWDWIVYCSGMVSAPAFFWFTQVFPYKEEGISLIKKILIFIPLFALLPLITTSAFIKDIDHVSHNVTLGPLYLFWMLTFFVFYTLSFLKLIQSFRRSTGLKRLQLKYVLYSLSLPGIFSSFFNVILPCWGNYQLIWIGPFFMMSMVFIIGFAIIRYRLMDLRLVSRDLISKILIIVIFSTICAIAAYLFGVFSGFPVHKQVIFPIIGAMTLTVFTFPFFISKCKEFTRRFIIKGGYDPETLLKHLTETLSSTVGFHQMLQELLKTLVDGLNVKFVNLCLNTTSGEKNTQYKFFNSGEKMANWDNFEILGEYFEEQSGLIIREEIQKKIGQLGNKNTKKIIEEMVNKNIAIIFPLLIKKEINGFLFLGDKPAVDFYTSNDLTMLETFASQASFAIENARLFSEIQVFNEKLKGEVKVATSELRDQNRYLATLRRIDLIIMETLGLGDLCQKIVDAFSWELACQFGLIGLIDENTDRFYFKSVTENSDLAKLMIKKRIKTNEIYFSLSEKGNPITKVINTKRELSINNIDGIFSPYLSIKITEDIQKSLKTQTYWIYPIISKARVIGALLFGWKKAEREITSKERDLMQSVIDQTGIALDNTLLYEKLKESVNKLKRANFKLRELDKMKDEFVSIASHELRTPMTSVNNFIWMVLHGKGGNITPKQEFYLDRAAISTQRLINLVEDMLTVSRIEGGKLEMNQIPSNIVKLAKTVVEEIDNRAKEKKVRLFLEPPKKELPLVMMDQGGIHEVLTNLISNAIKFTKPKDKVVVSFKPKGKTISTQITDNGRGIAKSDLPKLFKKFGRLEHSFATIAETGGTGLGLYICKQIVELHNGKIGVISRLGHGSTFYFDLKVAKK